MGEIFQRQLLLEDPSANCTVELAAARPTLESEGCAVMPSWREAADGARAAYADDVDAGEWRRGWQFHASSAREHFFSDCG